MPPPPIPNNPNTPLPALDTADSATTSYDRTRRSLQHLRRTLELRVQRLAESVERLREQARALEASMDGHRRAQAELDPEEAGAGGQDARRSVVIQGTPRPIPVFVRATSLLLLVWRSSKLNANAK